MRLRYYDCIVLQVIDTESERTKCILRLFTLKINVRECLYLRVEYSHNGLLVDTQITAIYGKTMQTVMCYGAHLQMSPVLL